MNKEAMYDLYLNAYTNTAKSYKQGISNQKEYLYKIIFYSIKAVNSRPKKEYMTLDLAKQYFEFSNIALAAMKNITPKEFLQIFPLNKNYDGDKYECKDYFYSMNYIKEHGIDNPIGDGMNFLWEYYNMEIRHFLVNTMSIMDRIRNLQGYGSAGEEFMADRGIKPMTNYIDISGQEFFLDKKGRTFRSKKRYPNYLRLIR